MHKYIAKRLLLLIPIILGVTFIVFTIMALTPGDPGRLILGANATQENVDKLNNELGYNKPFPERFATYTINAITGDFGNSYRTRRPVFDEIFSRLPTTLTLSILAIITAIIIGLPIGILSAVKQYSGMDIASTVTAMFMAAIPEFWLGLMLGLLFSLSLGWLPSSGIGSVKHFILPTLTLAIPTSAAILRLTRATMLETIRQDYIRTARAKGAPERTVIWRHALKNALLPVITVIGNYFGSLLGGTILVEIVFSIPGLGSLMLMGIKTKDIPQVMATVIFLAVSFCIIMMLVDIIHAFIDPRIRVRYTK